MAILTIPQQNAPETGDTYLSAVCVDGHVYVVDQHGKMVNGLISCTVKTNIDCLTTIEMTCESFKVG